MANISFKFDSRGAALSLARYARNTGRSMDQVTGEFASNVLRDTKIGWPVDEGTSRAAWQGPTRLRENAYEIRNTAPYARVIEFGGYPGVGPKTRRVGSARLAGGIERNAGIYPKQRAAAPVRRALARNISAYRRRVRETEQRNWRR